MAVRAIGCNETEWVALAVNMEYPAPQGITQKSPCLNPGYNSSIELEVVPPDNLSGNVAYEWQIPSSLGSVNGGYADGSIVRVWTTGNLGDFPISVSVNGACGEGSVFTDTIHMTTGFTLYTEIFRKKRQIGVSEELNDVRSYTWYVNGRLLASGPDESYVDFGQNSEFGSYFYSGNAYVIVEYTSGCRAKMSIAWDDTTVKQMAEEVGNKSLSLSYVNDLMLVSPNPANGTAKVSFQTSGDRRVAIVSRKGEVVSSYNVSDKVNSISLTDVTPGLYFVVATDGENKYCAKLTVK